MILHENRLQADDSHEISCLICYFWKSGKILNCRLLQIIGGALRVKLIFSLKVSNPSSSQRWNITIHHECPCRIEISQPRGRNFNQVIFRPWGWDFSILHGQAHDGLFFSHFSKLSSVHKMSIKLENFIGFTLILSSRVFLSGMTMCGNIVCTFLLTGKYNWGIS